MRLFLLTFLIVVMAPGYSECSDVTSQVLLECIDFIDFEWDAEKLETPDIGGEECTIDGSEVVLYREDFPESGLPIILTELSKGESFYRDETVEQGQSYKYRIRATYNCPKAGEQNVIWQLFKNGVVQLSDRCVGSLKRDLSLTADFKELEMHVKEGAKLTISGSTLEEPLLGVHEGSTLDISGATITTGRIKGEDSATGGMVKITGGTRLVNSAVIFYSNLGNECSNSTFIEDSDVKYPPNYPVHLNIRSDANVTIINNDIQGGKILVEDTPQVEIRNNKLRTTEIEVSTSSEHPADKVQIMNNQFSEGGLYIDNLRGGAVIKDNSFAKATTSPAIRLYGNTVFSNNHVEGQMKIGGGNYGSADVTLDNNLIVGTYPDTNNYTEGIHIASEATVNINSSSIMNQKTGIFIGGGDQTEVTVRNSCIAHNQRGLVLSGSYDGPIPNTSVDVKSNWWGHASGPKNPLSNPGGQGNDCVWEGIDFAPWLTSANCHQSPPPEDPEDPDYVEPTGECGGKTPCFDSIQAAISVAGTGSVIQIANGTYNESITLNESKFLTLQGGWDSTFTAQSSYTTVNSITISNGTAAIDKLVIQ